MRWVDGGQVALSPSLYEHTRADKLAPQPLQNDHGAAGGASAQILPSRADELALDPLQQVHGAAGGVQPHQVGDLLVPSSQTSQNRVSSSPKPDWSVSNIDWSEETDEQFVRRHSLSLTRRTPPRNSLAADILGTPQLQQQSSLLTSKSLMNSIKDIQEALSDFKSCNSSSSDEALENLKESDAINTTNMSRLKRKKKARSEYSREDFLKKQDTKVSAK